MIKSKTALIIGATGQDGAHLAQQLLSAGWIVYCGFRRGSASKTWRLQHLNILDKVKLVNINIDEPFNLNDVLKSIQPEHIYHFAGESFVADSFIHPVTTLQANTLGTLNVLEAIRHTVPETRLFFASSSEVFGPTEPNTLLSEESRLKPANPYGISKLTAQELVRMYRDTYNLHASVGILFNHEGPLRGRNFVTRKISFNLARLKLDNGSPIELGALSSARDWGAAEDYTAAMMSLLEQKEADDYVFATGKLTTVRDFLRFSAIAAGFDPLFEGTGTEEVCVDKTSGKPIAIVSERYFRPFDTSARGGNSKKLINKINWQGSRSVEQIATEMVLTDIDRRTKGITNV
ncbi:GDP-mannose 4,6-dehydratase [Methylophaga sp.]|uniref:GDP-mannose 4,6-dehydratase n=1 Tax=Methylophaga sp. TaxID=2024840 RepID=UPI0025E78F8B|nr:GDP-mannose 4,6-dehydratase [Methylophaga sp.]